MMYHGDHGLPDLPDNELFCLHLQPIVHLHNPTSVYAYELLMHHAQGEHYFSRDADGSKSFLADLHATESCISLLRHQARRGDTRFAINLHPMSLINPERASRIMGLLDGLDFKESQRIIVEMTEHGWGRLSSIEIDVIKSALDAIRVSGASVSLDDYGSGQNSISRLLWGCFDEVKIDGDITRNIVISDTSRRYAMEFVRIAHDEGMRVVMEHIETKGQARIAQDIAVDYGQGYLYGAPLRLSEVYEQAIEQA